MSFPRIPMLIGPYKTREATLDKDLVAPIGCDYRLSNEYVKKIRNFLARMISGYGIERASATTEGILPYCSAERACAECRLPQHQLNFPRRYGTLTAPMLYPVNAVSHHCGQHFYPLQYRLRGSLVGNVGHEEAKDDYHYGIGSSQESGACPT